ncbi:flavin-containing monooxygenase [Streptomyces sp. NPDC090075]|uniref:flavin-containing monooxygenase n=1 Tax=Streptomyces sp. NPDC090075 TaxID=3365937 RepID=UPI0037F433B1
MGDYDIAIIGAGLGGVYAMHRFTSQGWSVVGLEGASDVGGVWYHNRYPGARVDLDSLDYCYSFSEDVWRSWQWRERYAAQPELLGYLNSVADRLDVRRHFHFETWLNAATWDPARRRYDLTTADGRRLSCRFLVLTTGQLSAARKPGFPGLDRFRGRWVMTSHWPQDEVETAGKRIAVIGTGSSGVQTISTLASEAEHLYVFQRTANYAVPAQNRPLDGMVQKELGDRLPVEREQLLTDTAGGVRIPEPQHPMSHYPTAERDAMLVSQWETGGQGMNSVFLDQGRDPQVNDIVADFVRDRIRGTVRDPAMAEALCPTYPIGTRRLCLEIGYYDAFNQDNVSLVDLRDDPIVEITETGLRTRDHHHEVDLIVFALGFDAFTGAIDGANIRNGQGITPTDRWRSGPRTRLGMMTAGFPNLFLPTGPGSPSVLGNLFLQNEYSIDWIADCIAHLDEKRYASIEASEAGEAEWTAHVAQLAQGLLRLGIDNYMVHVSDDGSRTFIPYIGGVRRHVASMREAAAGNYAGFDLR